MQQPSALTSSRFSLAPMMDWSDRHCRYLWRLLSKQALVYTEMITTAALYHGDKQYLLDYSEPEHPIALQVGGSNTSELSVSAKLAQQWHYDEINLNCGCPSDRVQHGMIGACLMRHPHIVADAVRAMRDVCDIDVTVKHRIGVDDMEDYQGLADFVGAVHEAGCTRFIIHARKAWLKGLSPKENREVPPLDYPLVYKIKQAFPNLTIIINGGITTLEQSHQHLEQVDGVMLGREAYHNPYCLASVDQEFFSSHEVVPTRDEIASAYLNYCESQLTLGVKLNHLSRHLLGLYQGVSGARQFRRHISENVHKPDASLETIHKALSFVTG